MKNNLKQIWIFIMSKLTHKNDTGQGFAYLDVYYKSLNFKYRLILIYSIDMKLYYMKTGPPSNQMAIFLIQFTYIQ